MVRCILFFCLILWVEMSWAQKKSTALENPVEVLRDIKLEEEEGRITEKQLIKKYKKVAIVCSAEHQEYEKLQAWYKVMTLSADLEDKAQMMEAAQACYQILKPKMSAGFKFPPSEKGEFYKEAIRLSSNILAWYTQEETNDLPTLIEVEKVIALACYYAEGPQHFFMFDTHVRILLKLDKKENAYKIVYRCLSEDRDFSDFDDIKRDKEYIAWRNTNYPAKPPKFSPGELDFLRKAQRIYEQRISSKDAGKPEMVSHLDTGTTATMMTLSEAKKMYGFAGDFHQEKDHLILVFDGDVYADTTINDAWISGQRRKVLETGSPYGVLITGNLVISGDLMDDEFIQIRVMGNLWCDFVYSYNGGIVIEGDAHIRHGLYGEYNDGYFHVNGKVYTPYILADDHDMPRQAEGDFIYIEGGQGTYKEDMLVGITTGSGIGWDWEYFEDSSKLFRQEVWDEEDAFSAWKFFDLVREGKNPFVAWKPNAR